MIEIIRQIPGPIFLVVYGGLSAFVILIIRVFLSFDETRVLEIPEPTIISSLEMAYLVKGVKGAITFSVFNLWNNEMINIKKFNNGLQLQRNITASDKINNPLESIILSKMEKSILYKQLFTDKALEVLDNLMNKDAQHLMELYLLPGRELIKKRRFIVFFTLGVLLILGLTKLALGLYHHKPVMYLIILMALITILVFTVLFSYINKPTALGRKFIKQASRRFAWLQNQDISIQSQNDSMLYGVAIFGAYTILNDPLGRLLDSPSFASDFTSGSACSGSSCSGSGCGGSGCGGCGGD